MSKNSNSRIWLHIALKSDSELDENWNLKNEIWNLKNEKIVGCRWGCRDSRISYGSKTDPMYYRLTHLYAQRRESPVPGWCRKMWIRGLLFFQFSPKIWKLKSENWKMKSEKDRPGQPKVNYISPNQHEAKWWVVNSPCVDYKKNLTWGFCHSLGWKPGSDFDENWNLKTENWNMKTESWNQTSDTGSVSSSRACPCGSIIWRVLKGRSAATIVTQNNGAFQFSFFSFFIFQISVFSFQFSDFRFPRKLKNRETWSPDSASTAENF